jgi:aspartyl-tRNA(Asn)/glutamyl-tRNA(Gln) amidotransferase subunit A
MTEFAKKNINETLAAYRSKELRPSEVAAEIFENIRAKDGEIRAYLRVYEDEAMAKARAADEAYDKGTARPLEGIFAGVKDNMLVDGTVTTAASAILSKYRATYTGTAPEKIFNAGAIMVGKTNMDEFAMGSSTETSAYQQTRNPRDLSCVPGGSSGGSAAAAAAEMCHFALGSDTGGSIRQPAALCGVVGFKPSYGSVSRYGLMAMASSLDVIGPIGRSVSDCRDVYEVIRGADRRDGTSWDLTSKKRLAGRSLAGVRIGVPAEYFLPGLDADVENSVQKALQKMKNAGAELVDINLPNTEYGLATYYVIMPAEASTNLSRYDGVRYESSEMPSAGTLEEGYVKTRGRFGAEVQRRILIGTYVLSAGYYDAYYRQAQKMRGLLIKDFNEAWQKVDCIVSPTSPSVAWKIGAKTDDPLSMYLSDVFTVTANLARIPGISVPCDEVEGMPIGMQIFAPVGEDRYLLDIAEAFENLK